MKKVTSKTIAALLGILLCASSVSFGVTNLESGKTKNNSGIAVCPTITVKTVTSSNGCYGLNNGSVVVSATGGAIPYTFSWSTGATSTSNTNDTLKNLPPGPYTVNVTDINGCPGTLNLTLTQPTQIRDSISAYVMVKCNGGKTGNATVGVKGGSPNYTYKWTPGGGTTATLSGSTFFNNQAAGTYEVVVTDKNGCKDSATAVITQPAAIKDSILVTNVLCNGGKTGGATVVSTTGGTSPFTYTWATTPPTTGATVSGLSAGSYTLTTKDGNNCTATNTVTVNQPAVLTVSATSTVQASCGQSNGAAYATVAGGTIPYSFTWTPSGGTNDTAKGIAAGNYTVTVKDANGCSANASTSVTDNSTLAASITATVNVTPCYGGSNGSATGGATGGTPNYTYSWSNGATGATASNLSAGTYTLTVTDSKSCFATATVTITQPSQVRDSAVISTNVTCYGDSNGSATIGAKGGSGSYTFTWSNGASGATVTTLKAGTYTVTAQDGNGCSASAKVTISQASPIRDSITSQTNETCNGGTNGRITIGVAGGNGGYVYSWSPGGSTRNRVTGAAGTYTVIITDSKGCTKKDSVTITQPAPIKDSILVTDVACNGGKTGAATVVSTKGGTSPYTYSWSTTPVTTGTTLSNIGAGSYTLSTKDINGCTATNTVTVNQPIVLTVSATSTVQATCGQSNGVAYATVGGGTTPYSFAWTPSGGTNDTAKGIAAGSYTVTVKDANGCSANASASVTDNSTLAASISSSTNVTPCYGGNNGTATGSATGGTGPYSYTWSNGATTSTVSNLTAGIYTLSVIDSKSCIATTTDTIKQPTQVKDSVTTQTAVTCYGDSNGSATIGAKGGSGVYTFTWSNGATGATVSTLKAGTFTVTAHDANGCTGSTTVTMGQASAIRDSITSQTNEPCYGNTTGRVTIGVSGGNGGYTYSWAPGGSTRNRVTGGAGTYTVLITDSKGCTKKDSVTITQPPALKDSIRDSISVACFGSKTGSASVGVTGGTPGYTYTWTGGGGTKDTASSLAAGTYTVTVKDKNNCTTTAVAVITQPASAISAKDSVYNASCSKSNGSVMVKATGGTPGYTYAWTPSGGTKDSAYGLAQGIYNCTITDANGCTYTVTANVHDSSTLAATLTSRTNVTPCFGDHNGTANFHVSGGTGPYTYSWSPSGGTDTTATNLAAGTYTFTAADSKGCQVSDTVIVTRPTLVVATVSASTNVKCNGSLTGSATVTASGGVGGYTYSWAPGGATTATINGLGAGNYTITVTDKNSCTAKDSITITQPSAIRDSIRDSVNATCYGTKTGSASVGVKGGTPGYTYTWTGGGGTKDTASNLGAGTYTVTIRDNNNCTATASVVIAQPAQLRDSISASSNVPCFGGSNGSATVGVKGGTMPYVYTWSPSGATTASVNTLTAGSYTVTVSDANGCLANTTSTVTLTQPATALADSATDTSAACNKNNGSARVYAYGGTSAYTFSWSNGATTSSISAVSAGSYTCTITDAHGCTVKPDVIIADSSTLAGNISLIANVTCNGMCNGSASVSASGGTGTYTYSWTGGSTTTSANGLCAGLTNVQITDTKGCKVNDTITIRQPAIIVATAKAAPSIVCAGQSSTITITASGGTGAYSYLWSPSGATASPIIVSPVATTTYTYTVNDANNCSTTNTITVSVYPSLKATAGASSAICPGGKATVNVSASGGDGTYSYTWSPALGTNAGPYTVSPSATTVYSCSVTDGCSSIVAVNEKVIVDPVISITSIDSSITGNCTNSIWAVVSGGTKPYLYAWNTTPVQTNDTATALCQGNYTVTITDSIGCKTTDSLKVVNPNGINEVQANSSIKLYPVPANGTLYINISNKGFIPQSVLVYDITGRELINEKVSMNANIVTIDVSKLENGTYILKLVNGNNEKLARFTVAK